MIINDWGNNRALETSDGTSFSSFSKVEINGPSFRIVADTI